MGDLKPGPSIIDRTYKLMGELDVRRWAILTAGPFDCRLHLQTARGNSMGDDGRFYKAGPSIVGRTYIVELRCSMHGMAFVFATLPRNVVVNTAPMSTPRCAMQGST